MQAQGSDAIQGLVAEYNEFRLCREFGWTPDQLATIPAELVSRWLTFLSAEADAEREVNERAQREARLAWLIR